MLELRQSAEKIYVKSDVKGANPALVAAYRVQRMLKLALCVTYGALQRKESRGAHSRQDYPLRDDKNWLNRTLATWTKDQDNLPTLDYEALDISKMEMAPGWRGYGSKDRIDHPDTPLRQAQIEKIHQQFTNSNLSEADENNNAGDKDDNINVTANMQEELMPYKHLLPPSLQGDNERLTQEK